MRREREVAACRAVKKVVGMCGAADIAAHGAEKGKPVVGSEPLERQISE